MDMNDKIVHLDICTIQNCEDGVIVRLPVTDCEKETYTLKPWDKFDTAVSIDGMLHFRNVEEKRHD